MKKNILLTFFLLIFVNQTMATQNTPTAQIITVAELFETIKSSPCPRIYANGSPLNELAHFIKVATRMSQGIITPTIMSVIKAFLEREGKNGNNPFNTFYEDLAIYLEEKYPLDTSKFNGQECAICFEHARNPLLLSCDHLFCYNCLFEWYTQRNLKLEEDGKKLCPCCKAEFDASVFPLFISDEHYKEKSDAAMKEYEREEFEQAILRIILLSQHN